MLVLFLFIFHIKAEISNLFQTLANKAIENSKIKIPLSEREDTALPGNYSFPKYKFRLKYPLECPKSKQIKGYSVENEYLAVAKRKSFNLNNNFVFIDSAKQKIYKTVRISSSDDKVNIYKVNELTIFDILTDFEHTSSTTNHKKREINIGFKQGTNELEQQLIQLENDEIHFGYGLKGTIESLTTVRFKSKYDFLIHSEFKINSKLIKEFQLPRNIEEYLNEIKFVSNYTERINEDETFTFYTLDFNIAIYFKLEPYLDYIRTKLMEETKITKSYRFTGSRTIDITPYSKHDTGWDLSVYNIPGDLKHDFHDINNIAEDTEYCKIVTCFNMKIKCELILGGSGVGYGHLENGLTVGTDIQMTLYPKDISHYIDGEITTSFLQTFDFGGLYIILNNINTNIISSFAYEYPFKIFVSTEFCNDELDYIIENKTQEALNTVAESDIQKLKMGFNHVRIGTDFSKNKYNIIQVTPADGENFKDSYLLIDIGNFRILNKNLTKITENLYALYFKENEMQIILYQDDTTVTDEKITLFVSDLKDSNDFIMEYDGEVYENSNVKKCKSYLVPAHSKYNLQTLTAGECQALYKELKGDYVLASIYPKSGQNTLILVNLFLTMKPNELKATYDLRSLKEKIPQITKIDFLVYNNDKNVESIRYNDKKEKLVDGVAQFLIDITNVDEIEFYSVCHDENGTMCEIEYKPTKTGYQVISYNNNDGINTTYPGTNAAIIHVIENETYPYYYMKKGSKPDFYYFYDQIPKITLHVTDYANNSSERVNSGDVTNRKFCLADQDGILIPFSIKYLNENFDELLDDLGISRNILINEFEYQNYGCISFNIDRVKTNDINKLTGKVVDFDSNEIEIDVNKDKISYQPPIITLPPVESPTEAKTPTKQITTEEKDDPTSELQSLDFSEITNDEIYDGNENAKSKDKKKMIVTVSAVVVGVIVVAVIVLIIILVVRKKKQQEEDGKSKNIPLNPNGPQIESDEFSDEE